MTPGRKLSTVTLVAAGLLLSVSSCSTWVKPPQADWVQGWSDKQRSAWYEAGQGSRLMPWSWIKALEQAGSDKPFLADDNMAGFRFVPRTTSFGARLPIGFALDRQDDSGFGFSRLRWYDGQRSNEEWIGLNCSACHTAQIVYAGKPRTIDGAPSLVDFQSFIEAVDAALVATRDDPAKWERFATRVLPADPAKKDQNRAMLKAALGRLIAWEKVAQHLNEPQPGQIRYGYGRLDAIGHIFNKVSMLAFNADDVIAGKGHPRPNAADAPVNYPFLWDIYRHSKLQWDGVVASARVPANAAKYVDFGALGRNAGEVIGVFGDVVVKPMPDMHGFPSSVLVQNLDRLEVTLRGLQPPKWPADFPALDQAKVDAGRQLFVQRGCKGCHTIEAPGTAVFDIHMIRQVRDSQGQGNINNTDPWMACNALTYKTATGNLQGRPQGYVSGQALGSLEPLSILLATTVKGSLIAKWKDLVAVAVDTFLGIRLPPQVIRGADTGTSAAARAARLDSCFKANSDLFAYKARPLDGIWATPPYLHNGSVPTLFDLLRAPADRPAAFQTGTREYDPVRVGYHTGADAIGNSFSFDVSQTGNGNMGHDYRVGELTDAQRWALVEYMKTL